MSGSISSAVTVPRDEAEQCVLPSAPWEVRSSWLREGRRLQAQLHELRAPGSPQRQKAPEGFDWHQPTSGFSDATNHLKKKIKPQSTEDHIFQAKLGRENIYFK